MRQPVRSSFILWTMAIYGLICILSAPTNAQEHKDNYRNYVGLGLGMTTGVGLTYGHNINNRIALQGTLLPMKLGDKALISAGLAVIPTFYTMNEHMKLIGFIGSHYIQNSEDSEWDFGMGVGINGGPGRVRFQGLIGHGIYDATETFNILPTFNLGVFYLFK